ncbi:hypothetical protein DSO57_1035635 [Entomophthora muscae]|uniref:Uncharacterized protein n=1 Tax=Entomophthora muscae TaxID=34485 RepID=A0ACC2S1M7_9FUNG|nr:hypothetical protein DSO57_1035635 [Entomophthora muscae]
MKSPAIALIAIVGYAKAKYPTKQLRVGPNHLGFNYKVPEPLQWSGAPKDFSEAHAVSGGVPSISCYKHATYEFCLRTLQKYLLLDEESPEQSKRSSKTWAYGNGVKLDELNRFNTTKFLETHNYDPTRKACRNRKASPAIIERLYLLSLFRLELYFTGALKPNKTRDYFLRFPLVLEDGYCDSLHGFIEPSL